jgi:hypothetical protein
VTIDTLNVWAENLPDFDQEAIGAKIIGNYSSLRASSAVHADFVLGRDARLPTFSSPAHRMLGARPVPLPRQPLEEFCAGTRSPHRNPQLSIANYLIVLRHQFRQ